MNISRRKILLILSATAAVAVGDRVKSKPRNGIIKLRPNMSGADDAVYIQKAIDEALPGQKIVFENGIYNIGKTIKGRGNISLIGHSKVVLKKITGSSGHIIDFIATSINVEIYGILFDSNMIDSGIWLEGVENVKIDNCQFCNHPWWGIVIGTKNNESKEIYNKKITISNCSFENSNQTYEHVLILNSENITISNSSFSNSPDGIGIGLYQNASRIFIEECNFFRMKTASYYSLSCNNIRYENCHIYDTDTGIQGANLSDNGDFGYKSVEGISVVGCRFNNNRDAGLILGAVSGAIVEKSEFSSNKGPGIIINGGAISVKAVSSGIVIKESMFIDNNSDDIPSINAPAILFAGSGGAMNMDVINCQFEDRRPVARQRYPIAFIGPHRWSGVRVSNSRLLSYRGGLAIGSGDRAQLQGITIRGGQFSSDGLPAGVLPVP